MEINSHYGVLEYARQRLVRHGYEVSALRQDDDGTGTIRVARTRGRDMQTIFRYSIPCGSDYIDGKIRVIGETEDTGEAWDRSRR